MGYTHSLGEKKIETRSWNTKYRGPLYIHAGKKINKVAFETFKDVLAAHGITSHDQLPTGVLIAKCNLANMRRVIDQDVGKALLSNKDTSYFVDGNEYLFGDYTIGRYGWSLIDIVTLNEPIPVSGKLGLWNL